MCANSMNSTRIYWFLLFIHSFVRFVSFSFSFRNSMCLIFFWFIKMIDSLKLLCLLTLPLHDGFIEISTNFIRLIEYNKKNTIETKIWYDSGEPICGPMTTNWSFCSTSSQNFLDLIQFFPEHRWYSSIEKWWQNSKRVCWDYDFGSSYFVRSKMP